MDRANEAFLAVVAFRGRGITHYRRDAAFRKPIVRLETAKGRHKVLDLASRRGFAGFEVALNA